MSVIDKIEDLFRYREAISDIIRAKGIDIPENTKLKSIPQYINELEKPDKAVGEIEHSDDFQDQCVSDSLANLIHDRAKWTGHVDADGLREIGWTEEDIQYFQENGVDWMEEDDDKYLVSDYEKNLYSTNAIRVVAANGQPITLSASLVNNNDPTIVEWRNNVRWMPKFTTAKLPANITFRNFENMIGFPKMDFSNYTSGSYLFSRCVALRCVPEISFKPNTKWAAEYMFYECAKLKTIPTSFKWNLCTKTTYAFGDCSDILYLPEFNLEICTTTMDMFTNCQSLIGISAIYTTSALTTTQDMFAGCRSLLTAPLFDTSNCTVMKNMFSNCQSIFNIPKYDTGKNTQFSTFFRNCSNLLSCPDLDFSGGVTTYNGMFMGCEKLLRLPDTMDFSSCTNIGSMCYRCLALTEFQYKLDIDYSAKTASEGIKETTTCFYFCTNLKRLSFGKCRKCGTLVEMCPFLEELDVDDFMGTTSNVLASSDLFRVTKIGGELKGINKSVTLSLMRRLSHSAILNILNALEDVTGEATQPTITFGTEALRTLTPDEKLIATSKGWKIN